jgi:metal-responsive CopG/Arc/MetJ family transcriptional regulator
MTKNKGGRPKLAQSVTMLGVVVPKKLMTELRRRAKLGGVTLSELVRDLLERGLV